MAADRERVKMNIQSSAKCSARDCQEWLWVGEEKTIPISFICSGIQMSLATASRKTFLSRGPRWWHSFLPLNIRIRIKKHVPVNNCELSYLICVGAFVCVLKQCEASKCESSG